MKRRRSRYPWMLAWEEGRGPGWVRLWYRLDDGLLHPVTIRTMFATPEAIQRIGETLVAELERERAA